MSKLYGRFMDRIIFWQMFDISFAHEVICLVQIVNIINSWYIFPNC